MSSTLDDLLLTVTLLLPRVDTEPSDFFAFSATEFIFLSPSVLLLEDEVSFSIISIFTSLGSFFFWRPALQAGVVLLGFSSFKTAVEEAFREFPLRLVGLDEFTDTAGLGVSRIEFKRPVTEDDVEDDDEIGADTLIVDAEIIGVLPKGADEAFEEEVETEIQFVVGPATKEIGLELEEEGDRAPKEGVTEVGETVGVGDLAWVLEVLIVMLGVGEVGDEIGDEIGAEVVTTGDLTVDSEESWAGWVWDFAVVEDEGVPNMEWSLEMSVFFGSCFDGVEADSVICEKWLAPVAVATLTLLPRVEKTDLVLSNVLVGWVLTLPLRKWLVEMPDEGRICFSSGSFTGGVVVL